MVTVMTHYFLDKLTQHKRKLNTETAYQFFIFYLIYVFFSVAQCSVINHDNTLFWFLGRFVFIDDNNEKHGHHDTFSLEFLSTTL